MTESEPRRVSGAETPAERDEPSIRLPRASDDIANGPFPWLMMLAPAVMGIGMVLLTGSVFGLVFAVFGPVLALGTVIDQSVQRRRRARAQDERFTRDLEDCASVVAERIARERRRLLQRHPAVRDLIAGRARPSPGVPLSDGSAVTVVLGTTTVPSGIRLDAPANTDDVRVGRLLEQARAIGGVPHVEQIRTGAIVGTPEIALRAALGIIVDVAARYPSGAQLAVRGTAVRRLIAAELLRTGLHERGAVVLDRSTGDTMASDASSTRVSEWADLGEAEARLTLILADEGDPAPIGVEAVLELASAEEAVVRRGVEAVRVRPQLVSPSEFERWAQRHLEERRRLGPLDPTSSAVPAQVELSDLLRHAPPVEYRHEGDHLAAPIGMGIGGPVWVDLVSDGPHAVIGGTTGTGKSELLRGWITGLAARYPATRVAFLCIDFKGGATFDAIAELPHCVGVVTDLDGDEAVRVLAGLRAELRRRERVLRQLGARDIGRLEPGSIERLVVVVDEFQALMDDHRELHDGFADLAARGRSLGIHVVLCAQRPAGAARESLLANCTIRLSLRVTSAADSHAVIGSPDAAHLPAQPRGRAVVVTGHGCRVVQVAHADDDVLRESGRRRTHELTIAGRQPPRSPWLPPLPRSFPVETLLVGTDGPRLASVPIAVLDDPEHQRQPVFQLDARGGAHLVLVGPARSGKSTAMRAIRRLLECAGAVVVSAPADPEGAWDAVVDAPRGTASAPVALLIDDLDERAASFAADHRQIWLDLVRDTARLGGANSCTVIASLARGAAEFGPILGLARDVVRLGSPGRQEFLLAGGDAADYRPDLPPGRGMQGGLLLQFPNERPSTSEPSPRAHDLLDISAMAAVGAAVVTRRPFERAAQLARAGIRVESVPRPGEAALTGAPVLPAITLGEPEVWQQSYGMLSRHAARTCIVFDDAPPALVRGLLPGEPLLPPVADPVRTVLVRDPDREVRRLTWPASGK